MYLVKDEGLWNKLEIYTPQWGESYMIYLSIYLFITFTALFWVSATNTTNFSFKNSQSLIIGATLLLFMLSIYSLEKMGDNFDETFILSSVVLTMLICNFLFIVSGKNSSLGLLSFLPLVLYIYIYVWIYEIKNNY